MTKTIDRSSSSPWLQGPEAEAVTDPSRLAEVARPRLDEGRGDAETAAPLQALVQRFELPMAFAAAEVAELERAAAAAMARPETGASR